MFTSSYYSEEDWIVLNRESVGRWGFSWEIKVWSYWKTNSIGLKPVFVYLTLRIHSRRCTSLFSLIFTIFLYFSTNLLSVARVCCWAWKSGTCVCARCRFFTLRPARGSCSRICLWLRFQFVYFVSHLRLSRGVCWELQGFIYRSIKPGSPHVLRYNVILYCYYQ